MIDPDPKSVYVVAIVVVGMRRRKVRVAIVGGGVSALTAAFELTQPHLRNRYDVTIYQLGWRLGGKGASGRGPADRIEEHGLHLWMGFYDNAFGMMRAVYRELDRDPRKCHIANWHDAFIPANFVGLADKTHSGEWAPWLAHFPAIPGEPGDPLPGGVEVFSVQNYLVRGAKLLAELFASAYRVSAKPISSSGLPKSTSERLGRILGYGALATGALVIEAAELVKTILVSGPASGINTVLPLLDKLSDATRVRLPMVLATDDGMRRLWEVIDLVLAILRGIVRFGLAFEPRGFDAVDEYDWREWLQINGASEGSLNSAFIRGIYNLALAYRDGDEKQPALSAACALRGSARMFFGYRGALFWRMTAGMGDIVFAPLYEVLLARGVHFEFFHRLENIKLCDPSRMRPGEQPHVEALEFDVQAKPIRGTYDPLEPVRGLPCWPSEPDWKQLEAGAQKQAENWQFESFWDRRYVDKKTLRVVDDFDAVILGVGVGAIPHVAREIVARDPRWRAMVAHVKGVASQAFQLWMRADMKQLGWRHGQVNLAGFVPPFETWADMRDLVAEESWKDAPRSLAYFCSVMPTPSQVPPREDSEYPARRREEVRNNIVHFLDHRIGQLWPYAADEQGRFRWDELVDAEQIEGKTQASGASRITSQFYTANVDPTGYYTLSLPGTSRYRISPLDRTYDNFTIAGDWTSCGLNTGCIEAAVMSGRLASHAISLSPPLESIAGYDHP